MHHHCEKRHVLITISINNITGTAKKLQIILNYDRREITALWYCTVQKHLFFFWSIFALCIVVVIAWIILFETLSNSFEWWLNRVINCRKKPNSMRIMIFVVKFLECALSCIRQFAYLRILKILFSFLYIFVFKPVVLPLKIVVIIGYKA